MKTITLTDEQFDTLFEYLDNKVESIVKEKLTEGTEVSSNSMKALNSNPANTIAVNDIKTVA